MASSDVVDLKEWLSEELAGERQEFLAFIEARHQLLLRSLEAQMLNAGEKLSVAAAPDQEEPLGKESGVKSKGSHLGAEFATLSAAGSDAIDAMRPAYSTINIMGKKIGVIRNHTFDSSFVRSAAFPCVDGARFELAFGLVVILNAVIISLEMQYEGERIGYKLGYDGYTKPAAEAYPMVVTFIQVCNVICNILFTVELLIRLCAAKLRIQRKPWIWLDLVLVPVAWLEVVRVVTVNTSMIRIFRWARTIRVVKIIRTMHTFRVLYFMIRSLLAGIETLIWAFAVIVCIQVCSALFCCETLSIFMKQEKNSLEERTMIFKSFGTLLRSMFTMFEISDGNWVVPARMLMETVNSAWGLYFILYRCVLFYAIGKVIAAVFIAETQRLIEKDRDLKAVKARAEYQDFQYCMYRMFDCLDVDHNGFVQRSELEAMKSNPEVRSMAKNLDLDNEHFEDMFDLLQSSDGMVSFERFVQLLPKLKGKATSLEMTVTLEAVQKIAADVEFLKGCAWLPSGGRCRSVTTTTQEAI